MEAIFKLGDSFHDLQGYTYAILLHDALGVSITWCDDPLRFGWGKSSPTRWCKGMVSFNSDDQGIIPPWRLWYPSFDTHPTERGEYFDTFAEVIEALADPAFKARCLRNV